MGIVETGVRAQLAEWGIAKPKTYRECIAIKLAQLLDETQTASDQKNASPATLARELRMTMKEIEETTANPDRDVVRELMDKNR